MGIFICAFTATGKTTLSKKYKNIVDMESTKYKYINCDYDESNKSTNRQLNPEYPKNYFYALEDVKNKFDYILVSDEIVFEWLRNKKYEYYQVYPNINLKQEYYDRCLNRGNNIKFANWLMENWNKWIEICKNDSYATKHFELQSGEYLEDVINKLALSK